MKDSLKYWLALSKLPNVGPATIKKLYDHFGSPEAIWNADIFEISKVDGISRTQGESILNNRPGIELDEIIGSVDASSIIALDDPDYPDLLKNIYDPPPVIYFRGKKDVLQKKAVAIVGTRKPTVYGLTIASRLAHELSRFGFAIVSGFASGIDTAAHEGALEAGGETVAVFGCGIDVIYPPENVRLIEPVSASGCLISEFPPGTPTSNWSFPQRNRIISGLSLGTIVVEGTEDSGSIITAKSALEQGREVFAIPGSIESENSKGPHWLIKQGAKLVGGVGDVLEEFNIAFPKENISEGRIEKDLSSLSEKEKRIYHLVESEPLHIDLVTEKSELPPQEVASVLMMLEVKGFIGQHPGKVFSVDFLKS